MKLEFNLLRSPTCLSACHLDEKPGTAITSNLSYITLSKLCSGSSTKLNEHNLSKCTGSSRSVMLSQLTLSQENKLT